MAITDILVPIYGKYGGPGWTGGKRWPEGETPPEAFLPTPDDPLDALFKVHDETYADADGLPPDEQAAKKHEADLELLDGMKNLTMEDLADVAPEDLPELLRYRDLAITAFEAKIGYNDGIDSVSDALSVVGNSIVSLGAALVEHVVDAVEVVAETIGSVVETIGNAIGSMFDAVGSFFSSSDDTPAGEAEVSASGAYGGWSSDNDEPTGTLSTRNETQGGENIPGNPHDYWDEQDANNGGGGSDHDDPVGGGSDKPIILDLNGDGEVSLVELEDSTAFFDINGDGYRELMAWAGEGDGFLVYDKDGDALIKYEDEISFDGYVDTARTDLEGLAHFDTNSDGVLDAQDAEWSSFGVWRDADQDGVSDAGEVQSLDAMGITAIGLESDQVQYEQGGNTVFGTGEFTWADGTTGQFADAALAYSDFAIQQDMNGTMTIRGLDGNVVRYYSGESSSVQANMGDDGLTTVYATEFHDQIVAGDALNVSIYGKGGADVLTGGAGHDTLIGGLGVDELRGGAGDDLLFFDADDTVVDGGMSVGAANDNGPIPRVAA